MTDITPELEKVARAIYESDHHENTWDNAYTLADKAGYVVAKSLRDDAIRRARAALIAIREPTEGMIEAVDTSNPDGSSYIEDEWQTMIDYVLGGKP